MKCQRCKEREASVQIIQQIAGKKPQTFMLCEVCAAETGISLPNFTKNGKLNPNPFAMMGNVFQSNFGLGAEMTNLRQTTSCDQCGMTFDEFKKTGFLGCPHCYEAFATLMDPVFCRTQMGKKHVGRKLGRKPVKGIQNALAAEDSCEVERANEEEEENRVAARGDTGEAFSVIETDQGTDKNKSNVKKSASRPKIRRDAEDDVSDELTALEQKHMERLIEEKNHELNQAVTAEDYGKAAKLRDELNALKTKREG